MRSEGSSNGNIGNDADRDYVADVEDPWSDGYSQQKQNIHGDHSNKHKQKCSISIIGMKQYFPVAPHGFRPHKHSSDSNYNEGQTESDIGEDSRISQILALHNSPDENLVHVEEGPISKEIKGEQR